MHEAHSHELSAFITLTYDDKHIPANGSLKKDDVQRFLKRLRHHIKVKIKYYYCGEYGPTTNRPHYHVCLFGYDFADKILWKRNANGDNVYTSAQLQQLWPLGHSTTGTLTWNSAAYTARYIMKKMTGPAAQSHYEQIDNITGEITERLPEYTDMSRRPALSKEFFDTYTSDIYPDDFVIINGKKARPPKYYDKLYEIVDTTGYKKLKRKRLTKAKKHTNNNTPQRLIIRETIQLKRLSQLKEEL